MKANVAFENFSQLPDEAYVGIDVVKLLWGGVSRSTIERSIKKGLIPNSKKLTTRTVGWNVGELKQALNAL